MCFQEYNDSVLKIEGNKDSYFDILARSLDAEGFTSYKRIAHFTSNDLGLALYIYNKDIDDVYYNNFLKLFKSTEFMNNFKTLIDNALRKAKTGFIIMNWDSTTNPDTKIKNLMNYLFNTVLKNYVMQKNLKISTTVKMNSHVTSTFLVFNVEQI